MKNSKLIITANETYYETGEPILRDEEYDLLADTGLEIKNFRNKAKHFRPMGSLKKLKTEEEFNKWFPKLNSLSVTPKLDGNSIELIVDHMGNIIQAITRGDGYEGSDVTEKIKLCNVYPISMEPFKYRSDTPISIPCEAIMPKVYQKFYEKNIRNVVAGILGKKDIDREELKKIDVVPFYSLTTFNETKYSDLEGIFTILKDKYEYEIDGLVVELKNKVYEENNELLPANKVALKFNKEGVTAHVGYIEWNLGKYGRLTPVLVLDVPVEIDGTTVSRVSASNYGIVKAAGLGMAAEIKVIKSGDIIPFVTEVVCPSDIIPSVFCPNCNFMAIVSDNGVHMECSFCKDDRLTFLKHCFGIFDLEFISESTVELLYKNGYNNLKDIFELTKDELLGMDGIGESKANNIISKLGNIKLTEAQVIECAMVQGIGNRQAQRLIDHFGSIDEFLNKCCTSLQISHIDGFGGIMSERVMKNMEKFKERYKLCSEYCEIITKGNLTPADNQYSIVCTGTAPIGRKELTKKLEDMGHKVESGVTKNTTLLLTNDPDSNSGKTKKAKDLGINIMTYEEFLG